MLLFGAGGHAKVLLSCLHYARVEVFGIFDDRQVDKSLHNVPCILNYDFGAFPDEPLLIAIGDNVTRRKISSRILHRFGKLYHPSAIIDESVNIMGGTVILHRCVIQADTIIGYHVIINTGTVIEHDCVIGDFVHVAPGVVVCGSVNIGEMTLIGAGSVLAPNLTIGKNCLIAAGSVITTNIPDGAVVRGNPGRVIRQNR